MRRALSLLLLLLLLGVYGGAAAQGPGLERMRLKVGKPKLWSPGYPCMMIVCDDKSVVRVEDAGTALRLVGLSPGSTLAHRRSA